MDKLLKEMLVVLAMFAAFACGFAIGADLGEKVIPAQTAMMEGGK